MIYLDNAATTFQKPDCVPEAVAVAVRSMGNAGRGVHEASLEASRLIYATRELISELFGLGNPSQVAFTANSTESLNIAIQGLFAPGDHIITTAMEHNSVLRPLYLLEQRGVSLTILPVNKQGNISYAQMEHSTIKNTKAIICTHASNLTGNTTDLSRIGQLCKRKNLLFVLDASQSAGVLPIHMNKMGIHVLCFTGHKSLMGPQGVGGLCVQEQVKIRPLIVGGSGDHTYSKSHPPLMPTALEAGTLNSHGIAGLHAALLYAKQTNFKTIQAHENQLTSQFYEGVKTIKGVKLYGDFSQSMRAPIVTLNIRHYDSGEVSDELSTTYGIYTRSGFHCAPLMHESLGTKQQGAVRFSMSYFNTTEEINHAIYAVRQIATE